MLIEDVIKLVPTEIVNLSEKFIGRIYITGLSVKHKPVDIRIKKLRNPLRLGDIEFFYDTINNSEKIHKNDAIMSKYYPMGHNLTLPDGSIVKIVSYGNVKVIRGKKYVDIYCVLQNKDCDLIETVDYSHIKEKVKDELNEIIESNEVIKNLLPSYSYNLLAYNNDDLDDIKKFNAKRVLDIIDAIRDLEIRYYMEDVNSVLKTSYETLPESIISKLKYISNICIKDNVLTGFSGIHAWYNPRYTFEWLIYLKENNIICDENIYDETYLINKLNEKCIIKTIKKDNDYTIVFNMPKSCDYDFILYLTDVQRVFSNIDYIKYKMSNIKLIKINKVSYKQQVMLESNCLGLNNYDQIIDVPITSDNDVYTTILNLGYANKIDLLEVCTQIVSILSGIEFVEDSIEDYYSNLDIYLKDIIIQPDIDDGEDNNDSDNSDGDNEDSSGGNSGTIGGDIIYF